MGMTGGGRGGRGYILMTISSSSGKGTGFRRMGTTTTCTCDLPQRFSAISIQLDERTYFSSLYQELEQQVGCSELASS